MMMTTDDRTVEINSICGVHEDQAFAGLALRSMQQSYEFCFCFLFFEGDDVIRTRGRLRDTTI